MGKVKPKELKLILDYIRDESFYKIYSRNASVQMAENFSFYCIQELERIKKVGFGQVVISNNEFIDAYSQEKEFVAIGKTVRKNLEKAKSVKDFFEKEALPAFKRYIDFTEAMPKKYSAGKNSNRQDLLKDYIKFTKINANFIGIIFYVFIANPFIEEYLNERLSVYLQKTGQEEKLAECLALISTPLKNPAVVREHEALLKLALKKKNKNYEKLLEEHCRNWRWFPCYNPSDAPYDLGHYKKEIQNYTAGTAKKELKKINAQHQKHQREYKKLLKSVKEPELKKLIPLVNELCFYREHRNDIRREGLCAVASLYASIGRFFELNIKEICHLTNAEIKDSLKTGKMKISKKTIKNRIGEYVLFGKDKINIFIDDKKSIKKIRAAIQAKEKGGNIIKGNPASKGIAKGKVFVINNIDKLNDFKEGDILVASMTAPDYVPAMKKSAAIITDEGGIICHAAIISRELKKPCIIGTKIATKVLKDGQLVEVDANRGIVKILKK